MLARHAGVEVPRETEIVFGETGADHLFVEHEQMMPFIPFVRVPDVNRAIDLAYASEHGYGHTAILHSRDTSVMSRMGKQMDCTIFVVNGPSVAGLGLGGEGTVLGLTRFCDCDGVVPDAVAGTDRGTGSRPRLADSGRPLRVDHRAREAARIPVTGTPRSRVASRWRASSFGSRSFTTVTTMLSIRRGEASSIPDIADQPCNSAS